MTTDARLAVAHDVLARHDHDVTGDPRRDRIYFQRGELLGALRGLLAYAEEVTADHADLQAVSAELLRRLETGQ